VILEIAFDIALDIMRLDTLTFVSQPLTPAESKLYFYSPPGEIEFQGYESYAPLIDPAFKPQNFLFVGKQLPRSIGPVIENAGVIVRSNAEIAKGKLPTARFDKGVGEIELGGFDGFYLASTEFDTAFQGILYCVEEAGFPVVSQKPGSPFRLLLSATH